ncbi:DUF2071 domain-containing protein [Crocinitomicaceae bacterium CZZ-1]|uniref:DUF2071 domain-containing protein n=1 Tax=Taishania pollutisoli TaxID=2766479 RepID=A0A8J6P9Y7_9FLAO|nr:DUF2071 domain-containing protein [Taishania pollutisoli]MBC9813021.1 DUF2071 domain-containing protein [Taishania pollutisoli]
MKFLKNHPFPVEAFFKQSVVLTFAVPKEQLQQLIPECLELDTLNNTWGFVAVALVQTSGLRPKGFPAFMGNDFFLTGYRIFVRYTTSNGKRLRGLYILRSETNRKKMEFFGNIFTHYNYTTTDITQQSIGTKQVIRSKKSGLDVTFDVSGDEVLLPEYSPFSDWKEARRYAGPLPHTFTYNQQDKTVLIIEGIRQNWNPKPVNVINYQFAFIDQLNLEGIVLANAFEISNVPYYWKKGRKDQWK